MDEADRAELIDLRGRVMALEMLLRLTLSAIASGQAGRHPVAVLDQVRRDQMSTLQHVERPISDHSDAVWGAMAAALAEAFDNTRARLVGEVGEPD